MTSIVASSETYTQTDIVGLLQQALGESKATEVVRAVTDRKTLGGSFDRSRALEILEEIAGTPGIVGITARFAKARLHLSKRPAALEK